MDETIILSKIESLKHCIDRIKSKIPDKKNILLSDWDTQDIIILNLERSVQLSVDIAAHIIVDLNEKSPVSMAESFEYLSNAGVISSTVENRMKKAVSFRNIAVHQYKQIDWEIVCSIITCCT